MCFNLLVLCTLLQCIVKNSAQCFEAQQPGVAPCHKDKKPKNKNKVVTFKTVKLSWTAALMPSDAIYVCKPVDV